MDIGWELVLWLVNNVGVKKNIFNTIQTKKQTANETKITTKFF